MSNRPLLLVLLPSLRISGGNKEAVRLIQELTDSKLIDVRIVSMWRHTHEIDTGDLPVTHLLDAEPVGARALAQLPSILLAFRRLLGRLLPEDRRRVRIMLTHYATYPLAWIAPSLPRTCFNQDLEWLFVADGWRRSLLRWAILRTSRRSIVITTNAFVTDSYKLEEVHPMGEASIWAERRWLADVSSETRDIDVLMLVRASGIKRLDLYQMALRLFRAETTLRVAVITPDSAVAEQMRAEADMVYLRPSDEEMQQIFARSRVFMLLSDVEGFGLPPLEAMGSGCVPVCRDSGGVRCYMHGEFADLLFGLDVPLETIVRDVAVRIQTGKLPSPQAAREAFASGLAASLDSRAECVRRLRDVLTGSRG